MIRVNYKEVDGDIECYGCKQMINKKTEAFKIGFGIETEEENSICVCEECGCKLFEDMLKKYSIVGE